MFSLISAAVLNRNTEKSSITGISCLVCIASPGELWPKKGTVWPHCQLHCSYSGVVVMQPYPHISISGLLSMTVPPCHDVCVRLTSM